MIKCKYEGNGIWNGRCVGTKEVDPCPGYDNCKQYKPNYTTNADRIRAMSDEELAEFLTHINPTNCQDCVFSPGWRCQPDRDDYSDFKKCEEGRKRWLQQPNVAKSTGCRWCEYLEDGDDDE